MKTKPKNDAWKPIVVVALLGCLSSTGCGSSLGSHVSGEVTLDDDPLTTGLVVFYPVEKGAAAMGEIQSDGTYQLMTGRTSGLATGEYVVAVRARMPPSTAEQQTEVAGRMLVPARYADQKRSGLRFKVEPGGNRIDLHLESNPR